jgi:integrase
VTDTADPAAEHGQGSLVLQTMLLGPLRLPAGAGRAAEIEDLSRRAAIYATRARGDGTRRAYRAAWAGFSAWCARIGREPLAGDPDTIAMYLVRRADDGCAVSTLRVGLAAIRTAHLLAGVPLDLRHATLSMVLEGITRSTGVPPRRQAIPAVPDLLRRLLATRPTSENPLGARDRAMLLLGFGAALRRSELVALTLGDVATVPGRGVQLVIRRSKTDQQGRGDRVAVAANPLDPTFCPIAALEAWLAHRRGARDYRGGGSDAERPLFCAVSKSGTVTGTKLSDKAVVRLVKQAALDAGLDPDGFSGHSLRAGLATAAGDAGAGLPELMRQTRHKSTSVALGYLRPAELWTNNVSARIFAAAGVTQED